jgi:hypothetical protein
VGDGYAEDIRLIHLFDGGQGGLPGHIVAAPGEVFQIRGNSSSSRRCTVFTSLLVGVGGRWYAHVLAVAEGLGKIGLELAAIVGLPDEVAQRAALAIQMPLDTDGKDRAGRSAALLGEGPEQQTAATSISAAIPLRVLAYNLVNLNPTSNPSRCTPD